MDGSFESFTCCFYDEGGSVYLSIPGRLIDELGVGHVVEGEWIRSGGGGVFYPSLLKRL